MEFEALKGTHIPLSIPATRRQSAQEPVQCDECFEEATAVCLDNGCRLCTEHAAQYLDRGLSVEVAR